MARNIDHPHEHKQRRASQFQRRTATLGELIDRFFFIFAGIATLWLGVLLFIAGFKAGWGYWLYFVLLWVVVAYLALPRLHRTLTQIYVPNYFIGRTRTSDGLLGDPVNLAFRGSEAQLHAAMQQAGWSLADDITARSTWRTVVATLRRRSYKNAPVSPLLLFGRPQDFSYQQEVDGFPGRRHHVRFWHCPKGWLLPGGHDVDWLAAGTYDKSVGFSMFTLQVTHKIDENTDIERDYIVKTLRTSDKKIDVTNIKDFSTGYHSRNGGGDAIITDGDLPVVELGKLPKTSAAVMPERAGVILDSTFHEPEYNLTPTAKLPEDIWGKRPLQLLAGGFLVMLVILMELVQVGMLVLDPQAWLEVTGAASDESLQVVAMILVVLGVLVAAVELALAIFVLRGSNLARLALLVVATVIILNKAIEFFLHGQSITFGNSLVNVALHIGILLALSSDSARGFVNSVSRPKSIE